MKNFTISYQVNFTYEDPSENISRLIDITIQSKNLHSLQKILLEHSSLEDDVERNANISGRRRSKTKRTNKKGSK